MITNFQNDFYPKWNIPKEHVSSLITNDDNKKIALLIGISDYKEHASRKMRWNSLHAETDMKLLKKSLLARGFNDENIIVLKNEQATKKGILDAISLTLFEKISSGGTCLIHFSGHGQRMTDENNDEIDGLDEAIVPWDAPSRYAENLYEGQLHISDDEIHKLLKPIRKKLGSNGSLIVIMDSCYSGSGLRSNGGPSQRGGLSVIASEEYLSNLSENSFIRDTGLEFGDDENDLAEIIAFFGSSSNEPNSERYTEEFSSGKREIAGSLSYSFSKCLLDFPYNGTYNQLFKEIKFDMSQNKYARNQTPSIEGDDNRIVFGGKLKTIKKYFEVDHINDKSIEINAGYLLGVQTGTEIGFIKNDQEHSDTVVFAKGVVSKSFMDKALVKKPKGFKDKDIFKSKVKVLNYNYRDPSRIHLEKSLQQSEIDIMMIKSSQSFAYEVNSNSPDLNISRQNNKIIVSLSNGEMLEKANGIEEIWSYLQGYYASNMLRKLDSKAAQFNASLEFEFGKYEEINNELLFKKDSIQGGRAADGNYNIEIGTSFRFKINNDSNQDLYFLLLTIYPDNSIVSLFPYFDRENGGYIYPGETPKESLILEGKAIYSPVDFVVNPPLGTECYKLFTSNQPIDLSPVLNRMGTFIKRGNENELDLSSPLNILMAELTLDAEISTRNTSRNTIPTNHFNVETIFVKAIEKK